ncbi:TAT-variant-translocated molybdopterin oxidoreductase [Flammeovirga yaeyamensis]|uniref:TAT-variant-translocated molybdopterin oxidoreductase n=1 Tax=Flammeovirga yaeyamensis TaxID=367791 RepID=A0AAX1N5J1_9BACT|nr:TAT-variant-translocated molybdopterin oxidoreductase [Flammeovirga yaeyamensis]MBB3697326.1 molybdopterin-containing oxidoreductase family iron-sulfur binding subunit [Flammeovirga yaeyamensis]NMF36020.1 TAT-variant-translocated molybdopterin oxidoreductase [Flammeovirga yaeyamensis]QWG02755.1 TAT-variant-translocated molybdopterin oxidoreductase [Flammeovirga yaeyamensis]
MAKKEYWKGVEQLTNDPEFVKYADKEFPEHLPIKDAYGDNSEGEFKSNRRDFLKVMGFSVAAVSLAACEAPVKKAIPYLNKPENVDPGVANYYASTFFNGSDAMPVVVKTREGRPIFIEGNTFSKYSNGAVTARANASIMGLYDESRAKDPSKGGVTTTWKKADAEIVKGLNAAGKVAVVTNTVVSPSTKKVLNQFAEKYNADVVTYDQDNNSAIIEANKKQFGKAAVPSYAFGKADVVVSFNADFLGNWVAPGIFSTEFATTRKVGPNKKKMSQLFSFETMLTLTGAAADYRSPLKPSQEGVAVAALYNAIAKATGNATVKGAIKDANIARAAKALLNAKGKSLVVSGINDVNVQLLVNGINQMLQNYGNTIDLNTPLYTRQGSDVQMNAFVDALKGGQYGAVIFYNCNPVYDYARGKEIAAGIKKAKLSVSTSDRLDATAKACGFNAPDTHYLEAWNDAEYKRGYFSIAQPTINKIFNTRQAQDSFLAWANIDASYDELVKSFWKTDLFALQSSEAVAQSFWVRSLHNGIFETKNVGGYKSVFDQGADAVNYFAEFDAASAGAAVAAKYKTTADWEFVAYPSSVLGYGALANNPYIQETPDPITKVTWGNYVAIAPDAARELGVHKEFETEKEVLKVTTKAGEFELPVIMQPGLAKGVIAVPLGYGQDDLGKIAKEAAGFNAMSLLSAKGLTSYVITSGVSVVATGTKEHVAQTQTHETIMSRHSIIQETTLAQYVKNPAAARHEVMISTYQGKEKPTDISAWDINSDGYQKDEHKVTESKPGAALLWNSVTGIKADVHEYPGHHWGLAIDLNSCDGCSACVTACHIENNVPIVGKQEVINRREMHWLRLDRYYSQRPEEEFTEEENASMTDYAKMERSARNPEVVFQPMMCQHCNNAPCETVCPVAATSHSSEGLNQMTYNRCIGTKYCANNCPYKVRRFNWFKYHNNNEFDYHMNNDLGKMVLNPDVTVRSRGVMEKCSMCVQRTQAGKLNAKREGRELVDSDVSTACASACASGAIKFGDLNNPESEVRQLLEGELKERAYNVLDEINTRPNVYYLAKVRNKEEAHS